MKVLEDAYYCALLVCCFEQLLCGDFEWKEVAYQGLVRGPLFLCTRVLCARFCLLRKLDPSTWALVGGSPGMQLHQILRAGWGQRLHHQIVALQARAQGKRQCSDSQEVLVVLGLLMEVEKYRFVLACRMELASCGAPGWEWGSDDEEIMIVISRMHSRPMLFYRQSAAMSICEKKWYLIRTVSHHDVTLCTLPNVYTSPLPRNRIPQFLSNHQTWSPCMDMLQRPLSSA